MCQDPCEDGIRTKAAVQAWGVGGWRITPSLEEVSKGPALLTLHCVGQPLGPGQGRNEQQSPVSTKKKCLSCDWTKGWEKPKGEQKPKVWEVNPHRHKPPLCSVQSQQPQLPRQAIAPAAKFHSLDGDRRRLYLCLPRSHGFLGISGSSWYHCAQFCVSRMLNCWYSVVPNMYS